MYYTIPAPVLTVVDDARDTYELAAAVLREARADGDSADLAVTVLAAARAKGLLDMLRALVAEMERTGALPEALGLVGGRLGGDQPSDLHVAYCQGAGSALSRLMAVTGAVAA